MERVDILKRLLQLSEPLPELLKPLHRLHWDSDKVLVVLRRIDLASILKRYTQSKLTALEIEDWANAIEGRDDIGYEKGFEDLILTVIHELANPLITKSLTFQTAQKLIDRLG